MSLSTYVCCEPVLVLLLYKSSVAAVSVFLNSDLSWRMTGEGKKDHAPDLHTWGLHHAQSLLKRWTIQRGALLSALPGMLC